MSSVSLLTTDIDISSYEVNSTVPPVTSIVVKLVAVGNNGTEHEGNKTIMAIPNETASIVTTLTLVYPHRPRTTVIGPTDYRTITLVPGPNVTGSIASNSAVSLDLTTSTISTTSMGSINIAAQAEASEVTSITQAISLNTPLTSTMPPPSVTAPPTVRMIRRGFDPEEMVVDTNLVDPIETVLRKSLLVSSSLNESNPLKMIETIAASTQASSPVVRTAPCETTDTSQVRPLWFPGMPENAHGGGYITAPSICPTVLPVDSNDIPPGYGLSGSRSGGFPTNTSLSTGASTTKDSQPIDSPPDPPFGPSSNNLTSQPTDPLRFYGVSPRTMTMTSTVVWLQAVLSIVFFIV